MAPYLENWHETTSNPMRRSSRSFSWRRGAANSRLVGVLHDKSRSVMVIIHRASIDIVRRGPLRA